MVLNSYKFKREDNGQVIEVDFATMMDMDAGGYLEQEIDGQRVTLKRVHDKSHTEKIKAIPLGIPPKIVSDTFGCSAFQVNDFRENAKRHGFTGVQWVPEPDFSDTQFYQAQFSGPEEKRRYAEFCKCPDKNSKNGGSPTLTEEAFERARAGVLRIYKAP